MASQPKDLQKVAKEAADRHRLAVRRSSESDVDDKQQGLVDDLATKYVEARNAVDEEIKELQAENKGLWDKAKDAIGGAIETILKLKDMLLGVLARAAGAVGKIIKDPIGFLGNFVNAVKAGVVELRRATSSSTSRRACRAGCSARWPSAGIEIPETFDLKGIIKLVLSILGLTWTTHPHADRARRSARRR